MNVRLVMLLLLTTVAARERGAVTGDRCWIGPRDVVSIIPLARSGVASEDVDADVAQVRLQHASMFGDFQQPGVPGPETEDVGMRVSIVLAGRLVPEASTSSRGGRSGS